MKIATSPTRTVATGKGTTTLRLQDIISLGRVVGIGSIVGLIDIILLTVLVNLALWLFPGLRERTARAAEGFTNSTSGDRRTRAFVPWKAMLVTSLVLTIVINLVLWWHGT